MKAWMRELQVKLSNGKQVITFTDPLNIEVEGSKYMSALKDSCVVTISNITYSEIVTIINGKFYEVEVLFGYKSAGNIKTIFKGGLVYISNKLGNHKDNQVILICASQLIARFGQAKLNLTINSGINIYSALNLVSKMSGIRNANISKQLQKTILDSAKSDSSITSWLNRLTDEDSSMILSTDSSYGNVFSIYDADWQNGNIFPLTRDNIQLTGGYPRMNANGATINILPTFNFQPGDIVKIDNSLFDISVSSLDEAQSSMKGLYLDPDQTYMVFQVDYSLGNRTTDCSMSLICKSKALVSSYIGVGKNG